jgi:hypothetical protein
MLSPTTYLNGGPVTGDAGEIGTGEVATDIDTKNIIGELARALLGRGKTRCNNRTRGTKTEDNKVYGARDLSFLAEVRRGVRVRGNGERKEEHGGQQLHKTRAKHVWGREYLVGKVRELRVLRGALGGGT